MSDRFQVLALDGGGLKGLFVAALLAELEADLDTRVADHFDLVAGTSTGGLVALALGAGFSPAEIVKFYVDHGPEIFGRPRSRLGHAFRPKYSSDRLREALQSLFGQRRLGESAIRLVIPSYSLDRDDVYIFKTPHHATLARDWKESMVDVALATTAAPTFFKPARLRNGRLIDGGVWANNPAIVAVAEAVGVLNVPLSDLRVLSLGTSGEIANRDKRLDNGFLGWARSGRSLLLNAPSSGSFHTVKYLVGRPNAFRINPVVPAGLFTLDRVDSERIQGLAESVAREVGPEVREYMEHDPAGYEPHYA